MSYRRKIDDFLSSRIPRPTSEPTNANTHQELAITVTTPQHTRVPRPAHSTVPTPNATHSTSPQTLIHQTHTRSITNLFYVLLSMEPALSTAQVGSIIEDFHDALRRSEQQENQESNRSPFTNSLQIPTFINSPHPPPQCYTRPSPISHTLLQLSFHLRHSAIQFYIA